MFNFMEEMIEMEKAKKKFTSYKATAKSYQQPFNLTFEEYCKLWQESGKWELMGHGTGQFGLRRIDNSKPYELKNLSIKEQVAPSDDLKKYRSQKLSASKRNIDFNLTFEEWLNIWMISGKYELRGNKKGQYVMSRFNDIGPYATENVFIQLHSQNVKDAVPNRPNRKGCYHYQPPQSEEHKNKNSLSHTGLKQTDATKLKRSISMRKAWERKKSGEGNV